MPSRILLVSYDVPPTTSPRASRVASVARQLLRRGHAVDIVGVDRSGSDQGLMDKVSGAHLVHVPAGPFERAAQRRSARPRASEGGTGPWRTPLRDRLKRHLQALVVPERQVEFTLSLPFRRTGLQRPDLVVSFCPFFSGVLAGAGLAARWGVPHVVDYGDPWSWRRDEHRPRWRSRVDADLEAAVLRRVAGVIVNTEPQRAGMRERFRFLPAIACLSNGFDPADYASPPPAVAVDELRHLGQLYGIRLPLAPLAEALARTGAFQRVVSYGRRDDASLPAAFEERPPVVFRESLALMQGAGALLVVGNQGGLQIPSKVYHALGSGRPVLAIVATPDDPIAKIDAGEQLVCAVNEVGPLMEALATVRERAPRSFPPPAAWSWDTLGAQYADFLDEVLAGR